MKKQLLTVACITAATFTTFSISSAKYEMSLGLGSRGNEVSKLQSFLIKKHYLEGTATGYFGKLTKEAVRKYQKEKGLDDVGKIGPKTREHLNRDDGDENEREDDDRDEYRGPRATSTIPVVTPVPNTGTSTGSTTASTKTVSSSVNFNTPGGANTITVNLTGINGTISNITYSEVANDPISQNYYTSFKSALDTKSLIGKKVSSVSLSRVGGASLTTNAFMKALNSAGANI